MCGRRTRRRDGGEHVVWLPQSEREQLQKTVSNLTAGLSDANAGDESDVAALAASGISWRDLVRENQELRAENANMYILKEVCGSLWLRGMAAGCGRGRRCKG